MQPAWSELAAAGSVLCPLRRLQPSPSAYQTRGCGKSRQLSDERTLSEQHQRFVFVRLSSSLSLASWCSLSPISGEWADSTFKRFSCIKVSRLLHLRIVRHVENRNQFGLLTLRLQLNSWRCRRTRTIWVVRSGPVFRLWLLVKFRFIWASISRCTNLLIYLLLIIVWNHTTLPQVTGRLMCSSSGSSSPHSPADPSIEWAGRRRRFSINTIDIIYEKHQIRAHYKWKLKWFHTPLGSIYKYNPLNREGTKIILFILNLQFHWMRFSWDYNYKTWFYIEIILDWNREFYFNKQTDKTYGMLARKSKLSQNTESIFKIYKP